MKALNPGRSFLSFPKVNFNLTSFTPRIKVESAFTTQASVIPARAIISSNIFCDAMDWTGGVRKRFAAGKNHGVLQRQKAHFARARANLANATGSQRASRTNALQTGSRMGRSGASGRHRPKHSSHVWDEQVKSSHTEIARSSKQLPPGQSIEYGGRDWSRTTISQDNQSTGDGPIIYISSSGPSSPAQSLVPERQIKDEKRLHNESPAKARSMTEEDKLLLENRRRLLAQTDWLGLAAVRPMNMKFESSRDKARVGKRRKLEKRAVHRARPARQRPMSPLFNHAGHPMMSGALPRDDIEIKIGTDALATQTQRSSPFHVLDKGSTRRPSTQLESLSEESMLLGDEGDIFEANESPRAPIYQVQTAVPDVESVAVLAGSQMTHVMQQSPESPQLRTSDDRGGFQSLPYLDLPSPHGVTPYNFVPEVEYGEHVNVAPQARMEPTTSSHFFDHPSNLTKDWPTAPYNGEDDTMANEQVVGENEGGKANSNDDDESDDVWRRLMNIKEQDSTHYSVKAVRSSSMHITDSDSSIHETAFGETFHRSNRTDGSTPRGPGTQPLLAQPVPEIQTENSTFSAAEIHLSPSESLKRITKLADQQDTRPKQAGEVEDNELWRQFIIGSEDSSESSQQVAEEVFYDDFDDSVATAFDSSAWMISGLGTSEKSTLGDTAFVPDSISSTESRPVAKRKVELSPQSRSDHPASSTSIMAQGSQFNDTDAIEDEQPELQPRQRLGNIHAPTTTSILNPRRFKRSKKIETKFVRKSSRFHRVQREPGEVNERWTRSSK